MRMICFAIALSALAVQASAQQALMTESFDYDSGQWTSMGNAKVSVLKDAAQAKSGSGVLRYDYEVKRGAPSLLLHPVTSPPPTTVKGLRFWIKTDAATWMAVILQERGGPRYAATFQSPGSAWLQVELALADFGPGLDKNDPKDPNGKLDIAEIEGLGFLDLSVMMAEDESGQMLKMLGLKEGQRTIWLDEIEVLSATSPETSKPAEGELMLESLTRPQLPWLVTGWVKAALVSGAPLNSKAVKLDYKRNTGEIAAMVRFLPPGRLEGTSGLRFRAAAAQQTTLLVQVEETSGGKYNAMVELAAGSEPKDAAVNWSDFSADSDSKDTDGKLNPAQIKQILLLDVASMAGDGQTNTLWVGPLRAVKAK